MDDYSWEIIARDYNSPLVRNYIWTSCQDGYPILLDAPKPIISIISRSDNILYAADMKSWKATHEVLKERSTKNHHFLEEIIDKTCLIGEEFNQWSEKEIWQKDVGNFSVAQIINVLDEFIKKQTEIYTYGIALPLLDPMAGTEMSSFVEGNLKKIIENKVDEGFQSNCYSIFTAPLHNSFAKDQELDLLRLMDRYFSHDSWKKDVISLNKDEISDKYPEFWNDLAHHANKYGWVYYVYAGPAFDEDKFLEFIRDYLKKGIIPSNKLQHLAKEQESINLKREQFIKEIHPDIFEEMILRLAGKVVWAKPRRKDYQSRSYYHLEKLMLEISRRLNCSLRQARTVPPYMLKDYLLSNKLDKNYIDSLYELHVCIPKKGRVEVLSKRDAQLFSDQCAYQKEVDISAQINTLKGNCACKGSATGIVKIINTSEDMHKMDDGDILVSVATTPAVVPAMKKAAAILTDEGGLTCHAAIVSRELDIPCVVGLKIVTLFLHDGEKVEVNASQGIVKRL